MNDYEIASKKAQTELDSQGINAYDEHGKALDREIRAEYIDGTYQNVGPGGVTATATAKNVTHSITVRAVLQRAAQGSTSYSNVTTYTDTGKGYAAASGSPSFVSGYVYRVQNNVSCNGESLTRYSGTYIP